MYAIDAAGKATRFFDPPETYVWALAFDPKGALYVATGGEGRVYRVSADGKSETVLTSTETHILSLAVDARGRVYAGSAPEGLVYRIDGPGKVFVLLDSAFREIKALDVGEDGSLYAAAIDGRTAESPARATPAPSGSGAVVAEVTVSESYAVVPASGGAPVTVGPAGTDAAAAAPAKGALLRIRPTGEIDTLWSSPDDVPHSLVALRPRRPRRHGEQGQGLPRRRRRPVGARRDAARGAGHGPRARLLGGVALVTANPARVFSLDATLAAEGTFLSKVKDTETVSSWGQVSWEGTAPPGTEVRVQTRAGNTATPDSTWTDWSPP